MQTPQEFDAIRCYETRDMKPVFDALFADPQFLNVLPYIYNKVSAEELKVRLEACTSILDFQKKFLYDYVFGLMAQVSDGVQLDDRAVPDKQTPCTFVSNHRDIVLDPAILAASLLRSGFPTTQEIAIGDNLLVFPWIKHLVRLNKAFIVQRGLGLRETLQASQTLSRYMHHVIRCKKNPIWIAQREGRAKDSDDRTAEAVLKMMAMGGTGNHAESLREMNIVPLTLSYEYDPCDYLKAKEFQQKRDNPAFRKSQQDDLDNMRTGIFGQKGHVVFRMGRPINTWLTELSDLPKAQFFTAVAQRMDQAIHQGYELFPCNYVAADLLLGSTAHAAFYTPSQQTAFEDYLRGQLDKIELPQKDDAFLRNCLLTMYANPVFNHEKANACHAPQ